MSKNNNMTTKKTVKKAVTKAVKAVVRSDAAKAYMAVLAEYEAKNPEKFAAKKDRLMAKLETL